MMVLKVRTARSGTGMGMMSGTPALRFVVAVLVGTASLGAVSIQKTAAAKVTQKYLVPLCLDGAAVKAGVRQWQLTPGEHAMTFTMRNTPHAGVTNKGPSPGFVSLKFTPEAGHKYELEVRASAVTFSTRVWQRGDWTPTVRDRTADRVIPTEPVWTTAECKP